MLSTQLLGRLRVRASLMAPVRLGRDVGVAAADDGGAILYIPQRDGLLIGADPTALRRIKPGDLLFVPWGARHFVAGSANPTRVLEVEKVLSRRNPSLFALLMVGEDARAVPFLSSLSQWSDDAEPLARALLPPIHHLPDVAREPRAAAIIAALKTVLAAPEPNAPLLLNHLVNALLTLAIERCGSGERVSDELVLRALALMHADTERGALPILAARLKVSRSTLIARFAKAMGQSPASYARRLALARAASALRHGATARAACEDAGFASLAAFHTAFRHRYGVSPAAFRAAGGISARTATPSPDLLPSAVNSWNDSDLYGGVPFRNPP